MVAKNTAPKAPRAAKNTRAAAPAAAPDTLMLAHATQFIDAGDTALSDLISSLGEPDEVIERAEVESLDLPAASVVDADGDAALSALIASLEAPEVVHAASAVVEMDDDMLNAAVSSAEATEASVFAATPDGVLDAGAMPTGSASDVLSDAPEAALDKPKRIPVPRKHYTDKTERLKDKLGTSLGEYSVLTLADAVNEDELTAVMENTLTIIRGMSSKAQNWGVKTIEYLAGRKSSMSEVTARIFKLLEKDGFISTGATGNLYLDLISKPYSPGAARAMGGNNLAMMVALKIILVDGKGRFVANPESLLLMKARSMLFAAPVAEVVSEIVSVSELPADDLEHEEDGMAESEALDAMLDAELTESLEAALV